MHTYCFEIKFDKLPHTVVYRVRAANMTRATHKMLGVVGNSVLVRGLRKTWEE